MVVLAFAGIELVPNGTLFVHIFLILLMIWFLNRTLFRPIYKVLETRDKNSGGRSTEAREILAQVQQKESSFDLAMRETRQVTGIEVLQSPITALYQAFSQREKSKRSKV